MPKNWIIADGRFNGEISGQPINLDWVTKIAWGGHFTTSPKPHQIVFFHGVQEISGSAGSRTTYTFQTTKQAYAAYVRLNRRLSIMGIAEDIAQSDVKLVSVNPASVAAAWPNPIEATGDNLAPGSTITITTVIGVAPTPDTAYDMPVTMESNGKLYFTLNAAIPAGTYSLEYTDRYGNAGVLDGFIVTP